MTKLTMTKPATGCKGAALAFAFAASLGAPLAPAGAATPQEIRELSDALGLPEILQVMVAEGRDYGDEMEGQLFPGRGGASWDGVVAGIYDAEDMSASIEAVLNQQLADVDLGPMLEFFSTERGRRIIRFEVSARQAMMDTDIEDAAKDSYRSMRRQNDPRLEKLDEFAEVNDLVEFNVMGAMNASYAFSLGLMDGNAFDGSLTEDQILADVWAQEDQIRADTEDWLFGFLAMAYRPLEEDDLQAYIDISETDAGQAMNRALFAAFDETYTGISRELGLAATRFMVGEDI